MVLAWGYAMAVPSTICFHGVLKNIRTFGLKEASYLAKSINIFS